MASVRTWGADLFAGVRSVVGTAARRGKNAYQAIRAVLDGKSVIQHGLSRYGFVMSKWSTVDGGLASTYGITFPHARRWEEKAKFAGGGARYGHVATGETFIEKLRLVGVAGNKHIPANYLRAPIPDRTALLQGLMDSDGHCDDRGHVEYTTTRYELARDVREICLSLGLKASLSHERAKLDGRDIGPKHRIYFMSYADFPVFRLPRKLMRQRAPGKHADQCKRRYVTAVEPTASVPVRCITVDSPSELYLAGETMIPTHNSRVLATIAVFLACFRSYTRYLAPGEVATIAIIAADRRQARSIFRYTLGLMQSIPTLNKFISTKRRHR